MARGKRNNSALFPARPALKFDQKLVLNQWLLGLFEVGSFDELAQTLKNPALEGVTEDNVSRFHLALVNRTVDRRELTKDVLLGYDNNIVRHTQVINQRRAEPIRWKYFQYLGLLFTEIYLDRYFRNAEQLLADINEHVAQFDKQVEACDKIDPYELDDLNKLAFWQATGSGKTLLMHVNIRQYQHYLAMHARQKEINRIILLTPNEGLSLQHLGEFRAAGIDAELFDKDKPSLFAGKSVEIIDIHKLRQETGEKTVAIESFEGNNLVLVDEGHRGAAGEDWMDKRNQLCESGFSFEYSATFGQAVRAAGGEKRKTLEQIYAKCILFDYSYKYFYKDGFGKEYAILNLANDGQDDTRQLYLAACLLAFYQQQKLFADQNAQLKPFLLEKPLWIFVGGTVTKSLGKQEASDIVSVLLFLAEFLNDRTASTRRIKKLLSAKQDLLDERGKEIFQDSFDYLRRLALDSDAMFNDIIKVVFNASARAKLHVDLLKGSEGELALKLGDAEPFGVINVGDAAKLHKLCAEHESLVTTEQEFSGSLFSGINDNDSSINLLIGSKKFTEGWNSWRVATMGLMNIGKNEGSQIIQLFGRGVRLKGHGMSLKRSRYAVSKPERPKHIETVETLNVFGIRADYMQQFRQYLEEEGLPTDRDKQYISLPIKENLPKGRTLKTVGLPDNMDYKRNAPNPTLDPAHEYLRKHPVMLDWYPRIQAMKAQGLAVAVDEAEKHLGRLGSQQTAFMDFERIYSEMVDFKNERAWFNLNLPRQKVRELLAATDWYLLWIPKDQLDFTGFDCVRRWEEIAIALLKKYVERYYKHQKATWENDRLIYRDVSLADIEEEYRCEFDADAVEIAEELKELKEAIEKGRLADIVLKSDRMKYVGPIVFDRHLYHPLIHLKSSVIRVSPVALEPSERDFVLDLQAFCNANQDFFKNRELYLLRNESRRGVGFFDDGGFYPDFILWLVDDGKQHVTFVDPHGLRFAEGKNDRKIQFFKTIKSIEARLADPKIVLNSFIVSPTRYNEIKWIGDGEGMTKDQFGEMNVLFQYDDKDTYISKLLLRTMADSSSNMIAL